MEEEEEIKSRFSEEIKALGVSKNAIAQAIGFSAQTFTNVSSGRNMPGVLLLSRIQKHYPSFDSNYVIHGVRMNDDSDRVKALQEDLSFQRAIVSKLVGKHKDAALSVPDRDKNFREDAAKQMARNVRRGGRKEVTKSLPGRVQGAVVPSLFEFFKQD